MENLTEKIQDVTIDQKKNKKVLHRNQPLVLVPIHHTHSFIYRLHPLTLKQVSKPKKEANSSKTWMTTQNTAMTVQPSLQTLQVQSLHKVKPNKETTLPHQKAKKKRKAHQIPQESLVESSQRRESTEDNLMKTESQRKISTTHQARS